jgi:hypothetical protein
MMFHEYPDSPYYRAAFLKITEMPVLSGYTVKSEPDPS